MVIYEFFSRIIHITSIFQSEYFLPIENIDTKSIDTNFMNINFINAFNKCIPIFELFSNDVKYEKNKINNINKDTLDQDIIDILESFYKDINRYFAYTISLIKYININTLWHVNDKGGYEIEEICKLGKINKVLNKLNEEILNFNSGNTNDTPIFANTIDFILSFYSHDILDMINKCESKISTLSEKHKVLLQVFKKIFSIFFEDRNYYDGVFYLIKINVLNKKWMRR